MEYKYWLDTNIKIKFSYIKRPDLINTVLPSGTATITSELVGEYTNVGTSFQRTMNFDFPEKSMFVLLDGTLSNSLEKTIKVELINSGCDTTYDNPNIPKADWAGILFGQQGNILLTDDFRHIRKNEEKFNLICAGSIGILIANIIKGNLSINWATRYCKIWKKYDSSWVPKNFSSISAYINDEKYIGKIKRIFNL